MINKIPINNIVRLPISIPLDALVELENFKLFHITTKDRWKDIKEYGLQLSLSDFTLDAIMRHYQEEYESLHYEPLDNEEAYEIISTKYENGLIFATDVEGIIPAMYMVANSQRGIEMKELVLLGIDPTHEKLFVKKEIASDIDYISTESIPTLALHRLPIDELLKKADKDRIYYATWVN